MILLSFMLIETGAGLKIEVNRYLIKALHRAVTLSLLPFQPRWFVKAAPKHRR